MYDMARLFVANGYGFGKYWSGYIFAKTAKDSHFLYLADSRMAVLSAGVDEDGEKEIILAADQLSKEQLDAYFTLDYTQKSAIDWLERTVNIVLCCKDAQAMQNNIKYYMWPAVKLNFTDTLLENTIVAYDRFCSADVLEKLKQEADSKNIRSSIEFWSMVKMLTLGDRFGELAPKVCMESVLKNGK